MYFFFSNTVFVLVKWECLDPIDMILYDIIWIALSSFLSHKFIKREEKRKRNNSSYEGWEDIPIVILTFVFMPIALISTIVRQYILEDWN